MLFGKTESIIFYKNFMLQNLNLHIYGGLSADSACHDINLIKRIILTPL